MIKRGAFAYFGTAVRSHRKTGYWLAWATIGQTVAQGPIEEPGDTWFQFGSTEQEALDKLHAELRAKINLH